MIDREKVIVALERKRDQFRGYSAELRAQRDLVQARLAPFQSAGYADLLARIHATGEPWPGALPTPEFDQAAGLCFPFDQQWQTHPDARTWALRTLQDRPVIAVDGSQITPTKDLNVPVGAVQIGWYINYHTPGGRYLKDLEFEVLSPQELMDPGDAEDAGDRGLPNWRVNQVRFVRECDRLCTLMAEFGDRPAAARPLCFFDGSFIISFAGQMRPERAQPYLRAVERLLACSEATRVPLVAFVDRSYSRDFVTLVDLLAGATPPLALSDAALFGELLPGWGDRSPLFLCARRDGLSQEGRAGFYGDVAFCYVRLTRDRTPARVELPRWVVEEGLAPEVIDLVRAECVVGAGYPYAIETADALAVISQQDRERFYAIFEQFLQRAGLPLIHARKAASKATRR